MTDDMKLLLVGAGIALFSSILTTIISSIIENHVENQKIKKELASRLLQLVGQLTRVELEISQLSSEYLDETVDFSKESWERFVTFQNFAQNSEINAISEMIGMVEANLKHFSQRLDSMREGIRLKKTAKEDIQETSLHEQTVHETEKAADIQIHRKS